MNQNARWNSEKKKKLIRRRCTCVSYKRFINIPVIHCTRYENNVNNIIHQDRQCTYIEARSRNYRCRGKGMCIKYSECVSVTLGIQHAMRMRHIVICGMFGFKLFSSLYLKNGTIFGKNALNIKCLFIFSTNSVWNILILRRIQRDTGVLISP